MSYQSAAMYFQNAIAAVSMQTSNLLNYQLLYSNLLQPEEPEDDKEFLSKFPGLVEEELPLKQ